MSLSPPEPLLTGVVVHWHNEELLAELAAAWPQDPRFELLVVDNGSSAPLPPGLKVLHPGRNLGFGGGANAGAAEAKGDIILILNPDAIPEAGALEALLEGFAAWPDAAGLAPRLVGADGEPQSAWQLRRLPSPLALVLQAFPGFGGTSRGGAEPEAGAPVEQPAAAALAFRREALAAVGGFDASFYPAWFEDVDLARRLRDRGQTLRYWPAARFRHGLGSTVPRLGYGPFLSIYYRNLIRYLAKHHGRTWAFAARAALVPGIAIRLLALPLRRPRRARSRREALAGLLGLLTGTRLEPPRLSPSSPGEGGGEGAGEEGRGDEGLGRGRSDGGQTVAVCIVTHNSAADLPGCLESLAAVEHHPLEIVIVDCASGDASGEVARAHAPQSIPCQVVELGENRGFAGGMNAALALTQAPFVLTLNADAQATPDFVTRLLARAAQPGLRVGAVTGRLVRPSHEGEPRRLDACGMRLAKAWRHFDRGSGEIDRGQFGQPERVFGATGAASLFRREALDDIALEGEIFDPRFHSFREDAELCFRLRERGWEVLYEPAAVAEHRRFNLPERRSAMPGLVNYHSLKNRYLLRIYHQTPSNFFRTFVPTLTRDLAALGWVLLREHSSWAAYGWLWSHRRELRNRRRAIQGRRTVPARDVDRWFTTDGEPL
ncbi:MAG TPA: glycosyltransferase [Thermoanaerobaculia bacterium]|nr:glycosyltransferase [Thermoanaerobaculia bacterium]